LRKWSKSKIQFIEAGLFGRGKMLKKVFTNPYVIGGIVSFVILLVLGLYLEFSISESLLASAVLAAIGTVIVWWQKEGF
jgi:hypothetical protein